VSSLGHGKNKSMGSKKGNAETTLIPLILKVGSLEKKSFVKASAVAKEIAEKILKNSQSTNKESIFPKPTCQ